ncbi:MAG: Fe-S protein assembly co-chaperone HscB [Candidatus Rokuibacteriota bacterium]|nr:MAG: Fe-S protein assembly co-chaperone HscB [Candidatus Rokubacteria bacterium]
MNDYFEVFALPRKLQVDLDALQRRFYELSRRHHPDFHRMAGEEAQAAVLERSAAINRAYRALRDPLARVEYLIALEEGRETKEGAEVKPRAPTDLLEEMLEIQEALEDAKTAGLDDTSRARLADERRRLMERREALEGLLIGAFPEWDGTLDAGKDRQPVLERFKLALAERAYLTTVIDDLNDALGESEEGHVSHRRH